jgi:hypothetical protein
MTLALLTDAYMFSLFDEDASLKAIGGFLHLMAYQNTSKILAPQSMGPWFQHEMYTIWTKSGAS